MSTMTETQDSQSPLLKPFAPSTLRFDITAGIVVFLVALPLCLGIALASNAPLFSGLLAGIIGGLVVGSISGSHTSVSGPAAGLTTIVAAQIAALQSFDAFLLAVFFGGVIQVGLGVMRAGALSAYFPSSVIKGLLAAIGVILILKQIPHLLGHDQDLEGEMSYNQPDQETTFSELLNTVLGDIHWGAALVGILSIALLIGWNRNKFLKNSIFPGPLVVVLYGVAMQLLLKGFGDGWEIGPTHLVLIPVAESLSEFAGFFTFPDFSQILNGNVYVGAITIAVVASLETLLNLEAVDKLDRLRRNSPPSRELLAQGAGNMVAGLIGGIPVTSVIVRSSVNVHTGAKTKVSAIFHGLLLLVCVALFPTYLNYIPLSALAAILIVTGFKLASPELFVQTWKEGRYQFLPFIITLVAIVRTDLLVGILIGLGVSLLFILNSNLRTPIRRVVESHLDGDIVHIELANQVSFLNRAAIDDLFNKTARGSNLLIDASGTDYIDPDILSLIRDFKDNIAPARGITVSLRGVRKKYQLHDDIQFADYTTRELQGRVKPTQVLDILKAGNERFVSGNRLTRDFSRQVDATAGGQSPLAVVLSCIDSRVPAEIVFDLGIGDMFSVRVAGNIIGTKSLGSIEYGVAVAKSKLVVVLGHTRCGAVTSSVQLLSEKLEVEAATGCPHLPSIVNEIAECVKHSETVGFGKLDPNEQDNFVTDITKRNVRRTVDEILLRSEPIRTVVESGEAMVVGAIYDVKTGIIEFLE